MSYLRLIQMAREDFKQVAPSRNVLILHPQFHYHTQLINTLLDEIPQNMLCVNLPEKDADLGMFWAHLAQELAAVHKVTLSSLSPSAPPLAAAEQFCQAVTSLLPLTISICAYDNAQKTIHEFVAHVARLLAERGRFLIDSRTWPVDLVRRLPSEDCLALLPVAPNDMLVDYLESEKGKVLLEVHALGAGQVFIDGRQVRQWDGVLPRSLFFYFIDRGMTTRDEIFATFWPDLSTREATNVFHVTKRKISEILGVDLTVYSSGFYRISPQIDLYYDVVVFAEAVQNSAVAPTAEAQALLERAIILHQRAFLRDFDQPWATRRREELLLTYVDGLCALGRIYEGQGRSADALGLYSRAFGALPQREDVARAQMRLYRQGHEPHRALQVYDRLVAVLRETLGVDPSPETRALAEEIRQSCR